MVDPIVIHDFSPTHGNLIRCPSFYEPCRHEELSPIDEKTQGVFQGNIDGDFLEEIPEEKTLLCRRRELTKKNEQDVPAAIVTRKLFSNLISNSILPSMACPDTPLEVAIKQSPCFVNNLTKILRSYNRGVSAEIILDDVLIRTMASLENYGDELMKSIDFISESYEKENYKDLSAKLYQMAAEVIDIVEMGAFVACGPGSMIFFRIAKGVMALLTATFCCIELENDNFNRDKTLKNTVQMIKQGCKQTITRAREFSTVCTDSVVEFGEEVSISCDKYCGCAMQ